MKSAHLDDDDDDDQRNEKRALQLMLDRNSRMHSPSSVKNGREFHVRDNDIFVSTYPKSGTTWMQFLAHNVRLLRENAFQDEEKAMAFNEITEKVPWDILAEDCRGLGTIGGAQDLRAGQSKTDPKNGLRLFKSHESVGTIAKRKEEGAMARYVIVCRNPEDVFHSFYQFLPAYCGIDPKEISAETFCEAIFAGASHSGQYWAWNMDWFKFAEKHREHVLMVCFEDMKEDLASVIKKVAKLMGEDFISSTDLKEMCRRGSFEYMREHKTKFDDHFVRNKVKKQMGIPDDAPEFSVGKVRETGGKIGDGKKKLPESVRKRLEERWMEVFGKEGFDSYESFRKRINEIWK